MAAAPVKRKGNTSEEPAARQPQKKVKVAEGQRQDKDKSNKKKAKNADFPKEQQADKSKSSSNPAPKPSTLSVLRDDEPAFPRGGASVLTPLEQKQIHVQAKKDVLFEQNGKSSSNALDGENENSAEEPDAEKPTVKSKKEKKKVKKKVATEAPKEQGVRIEGLNFKVCSIYYLLVDSLLFVYGGS